MIVARAKVTDPEHYSNLFFLMKMKKKKTRIYVPNIRQ